MLPVGAIIESRVRVVRISESVAQTLKGATREMVLPYRAVLAILAELVRVGASTLLVSVGVAVLAFIAPPTLAIKVADLATGATAALGVWLVAVSAIAGGMVRALTLAAAFAVRFCGGAWGGVARTARG